MAHNGWKCLMDRVEAAHAEHAPLLQLTVPRFQALSSRQAEPLISGWPQPCHGLIWKPYCFLALLCTTGYDDRMNHQCDTLDYGEDVIISVVCAFRFSSLQLICLVMSWKCWSLGLYGSPAIIAGLLFPFHSRSTWIPMGDYIASNTDECTATLMYAVNLKQSGTVSFEYIYPDSSIVFEFFVCFQSLH